MLATLVGNSQMGSYVGTHARAPTASTSSNHDEIRIKSWSGREQTVKLLESYREDDACTNYGSSCRQGVPARRHDLNVSRDLHADGFTKMTRDDACVA